MTPPRPWLAAIRRITNHQKAISSPIGSSQERRLAKKLLSTRPS
jgi:hypothetical protein